MNKEFLIEKKRKQYREEIRKKCLQEYKQRIRTQYLVEAQRSQSILALSEDQFIRIIFQYNLRKIDGQDQFQLQQNYDEIAKLLERAKLYLLNNNNDSQQSYEKQTNQILNTLEIYKFYVKYCRFVNQQSQSQFKLSIYSQINQNIQHLNNNTDKKSENYCNTYQNQQNLKSLLLQIVVTMLDLNIRQLSPQRIILGVQNSHFDPNFSFELIKIIRLSLQSQIKDSLKSYSQYLKLIRDQNEFQKQTLKKKILKVLKRLNITVVNLVQLIEQNQYRQQYVQYFIQLLSEEILLYLIKILSSSILENTQKYIISEILKVVTFLNLAAPSNLIIKCQFIHYAKFFFNFDDSFKNYKFSFNLNQNQKNQLILANDISLILLNMVSNIKTDIFWQEGLPQTIRPIILQVKDSQIKQNLILFIMTAIINNQYEQSINIFTSYDFFDWIIHTINERLCQSKNKQNDQIILAGLMALQYLFMVGEQNMKENSSSLTSNPYIVKFNYTEGPYILNQLKVGVQLLQKYDIYYD